MFNLRINKVIIIIIIIIIINIMLQPGKLQKVAHCKNLFSEYH